jgi:hypothetical protein
MPIIDNRTLLDAAEALTNFVDQGGGTMNLGLNPGIEGTNCVGQRVDSARLGILYDAGSAQDWSGNVFYVWWNTSAAGFLQTKSSGGVTMRFTGATITDWFEIFLDGSDTYSGGWKMSVVDIDQARAIATGSPSAGLGAVNGTPPATTAIQRVGMVFDVPSMLVGIDDNTFVDALWRLPAGQPGIIISGRNTTVSPEIPWNWQDVVDAGDITDSTKAWGTISQDDGVIKLNTPVQFGGSASPDPGPQDFEDTNKVIAWETQNITIPDGFYGFKITGDGVNSQRFVAGTASGEVGSQGWVVLAAPNGPRWFLEAIDPDIEQVGIYGCNLSHSSVIDVDNPHVSVFDTLFLDGQRLWHSRG